MADNSYFDFGDLLGDLTNVSFKDGNGDTSDIELLRSIDSSLKNILKNGAGMSQANAKNAMPGYRRDDIGSFFRNALGVKSRGVFGGKGGFMNEFTEHLQQSLLDEVVGKEFRDQLRGIGQSLAKDVGVSLEDLPKELGREAGKQLGDLFKNTSLGKEALGEFDKLKKQAFDKIKGAYTSGRDAYNKKHTYNTDFDVSDIVEVAGSLDDIADIASLAKNGGISKAVGSISKVLGGAGSAGSTAGAVGSTTMATVTAGTTTGAGGVLAGTASAAGVAFPPILAAIAVIGVLAYRLKGLNYVIEGTTKLGKQLIESANRYETSRAKNIKTAQDRLLADVTVMVKTPFDILEKAAQELYNAWDGSVRTINATQGYTKDNLYTLIGNYADRLRSDGLTSVVSTSDITTNLTKVLESGLSGVVAEEFAYLATVLNAAIPTQDFFGYADTYSSIAANAIQQGMSQANAIAYANKQLETFAGNVLYANRELAGGFTTGLKDANRLFEQSVQIAQASKTNNASQISGVMTAVSAIVGAVAPDLASGITDAIYKAATGGNSSDIVALRSLAGINASNTEFLKQLANDPQKIFGELFSNLGRMQHMADGAYMEVAEGLSSIFGVSMDSFARVDFNYLAQTIKSMSVTNKSLSENLELLASGETTTNAEQMKFAQINKYMLEEGLSYVLDNEAARAIQQNMWDEQRAREIMEAIYGVELQGAALEFLEGIRKNLDNLLGFLNPFKLAANIVNVVGTVGELEGMKSDIRQVLELGKLGSGNAAALYQLTTRNKDLNVTDSLVSLFGGKSSYDFVGKYRTVLYNIGSLWNPIFDWAVGGLSSFGSGEFDKFAFGGNSFDSTSWGSMSKYSWGTIGKSISNAIFSSSSGSPIATGITELVNASNEMSATAKAQAAANGNLNAMLATIEDAAKTSSYDEWVKGASKYGIADFDKAIESAGITKETIRGQFDAYSTQIAALEAKARSDKEERFWDTTSELLTSANSWMEQMLNKQIEFFVDWGKFYEDWTNYFIDHTAYSDSYDHSSVSEIQRKEAKSSEDAVYALAEALTQNDNSLLDPTMQTNALLAQILKVVNALLNQTSSGTTAVSLPDTLAGLSLGVMNL